MMAQEAALKEVADSKLRMVPAYNKSFCCTDVEIGQEGQAPAVGLGVDPGR